MCVHAGLMAAHNRYSERIKEHFQLLVRCIDPSPSLLTELSFIDCLTEDIARVESADTNETRNTRLLKTVLSKPTDVVDRFISLLQRYEQSHVANVLLGNDGVRPMSEQHFELLRGKKNELCRHLNPCVNLLTFLESRKVLTSYDTDRIRSKRSDGEQSASDELLRTLERKSDNAINSFIDGLIHTGKSHVAYILTGEGEAPIGKDKVKLLDMNRCQIAEYLEPVNSNFVDELLSQEAITEEECQKVKEEKNRFEQVLYLVDVVKRKSSRTFNCFIETLKKTGQDHLAEQILGINGTVTLNGSFSSEERQVLEANMIRDMNTDMNTEDNPLHEHGIYSTVEKGSIKIRFSCMSAGSLTKLRELYDSGTINTLLYEKHGRKFSQQGLQSVTVDVPPSEFERAESCTPMTPHHRSLLRSAADKFVLIVCERLLSRLSLCSRRRQAILSQPAGEQRTRLLFDIVSRQADSAFQQLVDALRYIGYIDVAEFLDSQSLRSRSPGLRILSRTRPSASEYRSNGLNVLLDKKGGVCRTSTTISLADLQFEILKRKIMNSEFLNYATVAIKEEKFKMKYTGYGTVYILCSEIGL